MIPEIKKESLPFYISNGYSVYHGTFKCSNCKNIFDKYVLFGFEGIPSIGCDCGGECAFFEVKRDIEDAKNKKSDVFSPDVFVGVNGRADRGQELNEFKKQAGVDFNSYQELREFEKSTGKYIGTPDDMQRTAAYYRKQKEEKEAKDFEKFVDKKLEESSKKGLFV